MNFAPGRSFQGTTCNSEGDLTELVRDYLAAHSNDSFIDLDDMVSAIQKRNFRFSRMRKQTFTALVKRAYNRYLQMQPTSSNDENNSYPENDLSMYQCNNKAPQPEPPARPDSQEDAEVISYDSDVEIVEAESQSSSKRAKLDSPSPKSSVKKTQVEEPGQSISGPKHQAPPIPEKVSVISAHTETKFASKRKSRENTPKPTAPPKESVRKSKKQFFVVETSQVSFSEFAGADKVIEEICQLLLHLKHPEVYQVLGVTPPRGFLLHGPPGSGKTLLANAIAGEIKLPMFKMASTELISGISGESESNIRELFQQALDLAPCIIFLDEIDSITPKRETAQREMERRIVAQLLACIDDLATKEKGELVVLIGATNRLESIDSALRRAGRFDREISIGIPDESSREKILRVICKNLRLEPNFNFTLLAKLTPGYVGADLQALAREAAVQAVNLALAPAIPTTIPKFPGIFHEQQKISDSVESPSEKELEKGSKREASLGSAAHPVGKLNASVDDPNHSIGKENETASRTNELNLSTTDTNHPAKTPNATTEANPPPGDKTAPIDDMRNHSGEMQGTSSAVTSSTGDVEEIISLEKDENSKDTGAMEVDSSGPPVVELIDENSTGLYDDIIPGKPTPHDGSEGGLNLPEEVHPAWLLNTSPISDEKLSKIFVEMKHFQAALKYVQPSSKREGFATVPDTTWDEIGALKEIRDELQVSILGPVKYPEAFMSLGINSPAGVLLCGPPGCGKTLLAKAVANEAGINFISVKGPELLNMYVGESERAVRQCFLRAKNSAPCVIFFDELDALCPRRSDGADVNSTSRVVNQLLTEMDGIEGRLGVYIMAATNRPDIIDPAVLRPGRLDKILFVDIPSAEDRVDILRTITKGGTRPKLENDVNISDIAASDKCNGFTGADLSALVREASVAAFRELVLQPHLTNSEQVIPTNDLKVSNRHFEAAFLKIKPSVSAQSLTKYAQLKEKYATLIR